MINRVLTCDLFSSLDHAQTLPGKSRNLRCVLRPCACRTPNTPHDRKRIAVSGDAQGQGGCTGDAETSNLLQRSIDDADVLEGCKRKRSMHAKRVLQSHGIEPKTVLCLQHRVG